MKRRSYPSGSESIHKRCLRSGISGADQFLPNKLINVQEIRTQRAPQVANTLSPTSLAVTDKALDFGLTLEAWADNVALTGRRVDSFNVKLENDVI